MSLTNMYQRTWRSYEKRLRIKSLNRGNYSSSRFFSNPVSRLFSVVGNTQRVSLSDLIPQDTAGYRRLPQETAGYLYIKTYHFILINFIARKYFMDI